MTTTSHNLLAYEKVRDGILQLIVDDALNEGDRLPSQRALANRFGVNQRTVIRGIDELSSRGLLQRRIGSGVYVNYLKAGKVHHAARQLLGRPKQSNKQQLTLGILTDNQADLHGQELLKQIQHVAAAQQYDLLIRATDQHADPQQLLHQAMSLSQQQCDAILVLRSHVQRSAEVWITLTQQASIPVVFSRHVTSTDPIHYWGSEYGASIDDKPTFRQNTCDMVVQYLLTVGSERIGYWGPRDQTDSAQHALANFMQACAKRSMPCMVGLVDRPVESADEIVRQWIPFNKRTVIYCYDDQSALRLLTSLHKHGIGIPQQVGIIGHNDTDICSFTDPPLTSTRFPFDYVARAMLHYASTWVRDGHPTRMAQTAIPKLIVRQSCGGQLLLGMQLQDTLDQINHANRGNFHIQLQESAT